MAKTVLRPNVRYRTPKRKPRNNQERAEAIFSPQNETAAQFQARNKTRGAVSQLGGTATLMGALSAVGKLAKQAKGRPR